MNPTQAGEAVKKVWRRFWNWYHDPKRIRVAHDGTLYVLDPVSPDQLAAAKKISASLRTRKRP